MTDPSIIAEALRVAAASIPGILDSQLGMNALTVTPAVEVWLEGGTVEQIRAGGNDELREIHTFQVAFYIPLQSNLSEDEIIIGGFIKAFVDKIHSAAFDYTLGGLVELTRATRYATDLVLRNNRPYRAGIIGIEAGEL